MADIISPEQRSKNMSAIPSKNTRPEIYLRKLLFAKGFRYRIAEKSVTGYPDVFLRKYNTAIFVHGCFWHRHEGCKLATIPKTRTEFWMEKFAKNVANDKKHYEQLRDMGWNVIVIWECELENDFKTTMEKVVCDIRSNVESE